jgi:hypothetical protein
VDDAPRSPQSLLIGRTSALEQPGHRRLCSVDADIVQYLAKQPGTYRFAGVYRNDGGAPVNVFQVVMAPFDADDLETCAFQSRDQ